MGFLYWPRFSGSDGLEGPLGGPNGSTSRQLWGYLQTVMVPTSLFIISTGPAREELEAGSSGGRSPKTGKVRPIKGP